MQTSADFVIVGGGCIGVSVAWHLAKRKAGKIVLLEKAEFLGTESTGKCAGGIRAQFSTEVNTRLSLHSIDIFERWAEVIGEPLQYRQWGYCFLLTSDALVASFRKSHAMWTRLDMKVEWLSPGQVEVRLPYVNIDGVLGATFHQRDGFGDPNDITMGYAKRAREMGVIVETGVEVQQIKRDSLNRSATAVQTNRGEIKAGKVILCTGAWTRKIAALAGVDVPIEPIRRQIIVTDKFDGITDPFPMTVDLSTTLYFHRESGGILIGMSNQAETPGFETGFDEEYGEKMLLTAMERAPVLANASPKHKWAGLYEVTPDHHPVIDRLVPLDNVYCCAGFSGHGLMHAPAAGLVTSELVLDGSSKLVDMREISLERFRNPEALRDETNVI